MSSYNGLHRVENGRKKSRLDPYLFPHLTRPFLYLRKKSRNRAETGESIMSVFVGSRFLSDLTCFYSVFKKSGLSPIHISTQTKAPYS
jgi:hypothetical protein